MRHSFSVAAVSTKARLLRMFLVLPLLASAQQPAQQPAKAGGQSQGQASTGVATFSSTAQLVLEQVTVKGKDGSGIDNLKKEDFSITEDNKPQTIRVFEYQKLDDIVAAPELQT